MTKTLPAPAMPLGVSFDPELTLIENAHAAWTGRKSVSRSQSEQAAKQLTRKVFKTDDLVFQYREAIDPEVPLFTVEDELIAFGHDRQLALVEFCAECGNEWTLRAFRDLAGLGRALAVRDESYAFVCRDCQVEGHVRKARKVKA